MKECSSTGQKPRKDQELIRRRAFGIKYENPLFRILLAGVSGGADKLRTPCANVAYYSTSNSEQMNVHGSGQLLDKGSRQRR